MKKRYLSNYSLRFKCRCAFSASEEERGKPESAYRYKGINDSAEDIALTAEYPCNDIKTEKSNRPPVDSADNTKKQCYSVKYHKFILLVIYFARTKNKYTLTLRYFLVIIFA